MYNPEYSIFELFSKSARIFKDNIFLILIITLVAFTPIFILRFFIPVGFAEAFFQFQELLSQFGSDAVSIFDNPDALIFMFIAGIIDAIFTPISVAAITYIVARAIKDIKPNMSEMFAFSIGKILRLLATSLIFVAIVLLVGIIIVVLVLFFSLPPFIINMLVIGAMLMLVRFVFVHNIVADTKFFGLQAIKYNFYITKGRWLKTLGYIILLGLVSIGLGQAFAPIRSLISVNIPMAFIGFIAEHLLLAFVAVVTAFWYYDIKLHTEFPPHFINEDINENITK